MGGFDANNYKYDGYIVSEIDEGFYHVQLNNPKTLNAFSEKTWRNYSEILERLDKEEQSNVILISSTVTKAFSSGLDLKESIANFGKFGDLTEQQRYQELHQHLRDFQHCIAAPARINTPTICLMNGINYGLALDMCACCSIRVATEDCRFSIREIKIGIAADIGSLQRLPALVSNKSLLYQYALTGAVFGYKEAQELGLVSKVVPNLEAGVAWCTELGLDINGNQPWAIRATKSSLQDMVNGTTVEQGLKDIAHINATNMDGKFLKMMSSFKL